MSGCVVSALERSWAASASGCIERPRAPLNGRERCKRGDQYGRQHSSAQNRVLRYGLQQARRLQRGHGL
jgi:hypothetical protein